MYKFPPSRVLLTLHCLPQESVRYLHAIRRGLNSDSAGLVVARLAGMPARAILEARKIRDMLLVEGQVY